MKVSIENYTPKTLAVKIEPVIFYRALFVDRDGCDCCTSIRFNSIKDLEDHYLYLCDNPNFMGVVKFED